MIDVDIVLSKFLDQLMAGAWSKNARFFIICGNFFLRNLSSLTIRLIENALNTTLPTTVDKLLEKLSTPEQENEDSEVCLE